jgi:hypothetical protein
MKFISFVRLFALPAVLSLTTLAAHADSFDWTLTGPAASLGGFSDTGSGTLTANLSSGEWVISAITGTVGGSAITGLVDFRTADNLLFPDTTFLDTDGLGFETANGAEFNVFSFFAPNATDITPGNNYGEIVSNAAFGVGTFSLTPNSPVPEPSTFLMLGTGLLGAAGAVRRKLVRA